MVHSQQHKPILCKLLAGFHTGGRGGRGAEFPPLRSLKTYFALKQGTMAPDQLVLQHRLATPTYSFSCTDTCYYAVVWTQTWGSRLSYQIQSLGSCFVIICCGACYSKKDSPITISHINIL